MDFTHLMTYLLLLSTALLIITTETSAKPASDGIIDSLKTGYYYIDNGTIKAAKRTDALGASAQNTPTGGRRQDSSVNDGVNQLPDGVKYTPLVRFKQTKTNKHKKLFVPNFFG